MKKVAVALVLMGLALVACNKSTAENPVDESSDVKSNHAVSVVNDKSGDNGQNIQKDELFEDSTETEDTDEFQDSVTIGDNPTVPCDGDCPDEHEDSEQEDLIHEYARNRDDAKPPAMYGPPPNRDVIMDKRLIKRVVRMHSEEISKCYQDSYKNRKDGGRVVVKWRIGSDGKVPECLIKESNLQNRKFESCLINQIKSWRFPLPRNGESVTVEYPFVFNADGT